MTKNNGSTGILACGAYVPSLRLSRKAIVDANSWFNPLPHSISDGERSICNWDEDSLTMAVAAARDCLTERAKDAIGAVHLSSTSLPFDDRQNATILGEVLSLGEQLRTMDITSSLRAGTSSLLNALSLGNNEATLVVSSDNRGAKAASTQELQFGDGAAAFLIGAGPIIAEFIGGHTRSVDFVDHFRGRNRRFDYDWEQRWVREEGYGKIIPRTVTALLDEVGVAANSIKHFIVPVAAASVASRLAKGLDISTSAVCDNLQTVLGNCGAAHAPVMLAHALQKAEPGQYILVVGWGQGCDALLFRTTDQISEPTHSLGVEGHLQRRRADANYNRYLAFNGLIEQEHGIRAESDFSPVLSALYRSRESVLGFVGSQCRECGTRQIPRSNICVNPECNAAHSQDPEPFADVSGTIQSWTADHLVFSPDPPSYYGMVKFEGGGQLMVDMTDVERGGVSSGMTVRMVFRIKAHDQKRGYTRYFWKATPT